MSGSTRRSIAKFVFCSSGDVARTVWGTIVACRVAVVNAVVEEIRMRRSMTELSGMDENMLRDVGLARLDVEHVARHAAFERKEAT
jgi:uncharacterized protein YjiS (DUF1127 family)